MNKSRAKLGTIIISGFSILLFLYVIPSVFGAFFIDMYMTTANECNRLMGFELVVKNSYFLPIILSYKGADIAVDILAKDGSRTFKATFVNDNMHDDEEGNVHVSRISPGNSVFYVNMNESTQYYQTFKIPNIASENYNFYGTAFGREIYSVNNDYIDTNAVNKPC